MMVIAILILAAVSFVLFIWLLQYRRQVRRLGRQIAFLRSDETNMLITTDLVSGDVIGLAEEMNQLLSKYRDSVTEYSRKDKRLKETITSLSHDIRTPLTSLDGYFQLLNECHDEEEKEKYIKIIRERIKSLNDMLEELFTYAKLQDGEYPLPMQKENFNEIIYESIFPFYDDFKAAGMEPDIQVTTEIQYCICSRSAVHRIIQNIVKNALVHSYKKVGIRLYVYEDRVWFECYNDVEHPEEVDASMVFERFYKADAARSRISSGLGLSIAKGLTEKMNGNIAASLSRDIFTISVSFPRL